MPPICAFDRGEAVIELLDCVVEIRLRDHVILDEIDGLKDVLCVFVHMRGSIAYRSAGARVRRLGGSHAA